MGGCAGGPQCREVASGRLGDMQTRTLGRTGRDVSVIGLGTWQLGADWGDVDESDAMAVLDAAAGAGVTSSTPPMFTATAAAKSLIGRWLAAEPGFGGVRGHQDGPARPRRIRPSSPRPTSAPGPTGRGATSGVERLDLVQLHCPPTAVFADDAVFDALDALVADGAIANYGVSVETCDEALDGDRPAERRVRPDHPERVPAQAAGRGAAGRGGRRRRHHRPGAAGQRPALRPVRPRHHVRRQRPPHLQPARRVVRRRGDVLRCRLRRRGGRGPRVRLRRPRVRGRCPGGAPSTAQLALAWIARIPAVSTVIPGARNPDQAVSNAAAGSIELSDGIDDLVRSLYDRSFRAAVHPRW